MKTKFVVKRTTAFATRQFDMHRVMVRSSDDCDQFRFRHESLHDESCQGALHAQQRQTRLIKQAKRISYDFLYSFKADINCIIVEKALN